MFSTPGIKGISRIEAAYEESDRRRYHVPCPHCGAMQPLRWAGLVWEKDENGDHLPETAKYQCAKCSKLIDELDKPATLEAGEWLAELPGVRIAGFHLNALYSPWVRWAELVDDFLKSKDDPSRLQVFVNTVLGETWEETAEKIDATSLSARREAYDAEVPAPVGVLTAGVDIQVDRLELAVKGWAQDEESYLIAHHRLHGDPEGGEVWQRLETLLSKPYGHASGGELRIRSTMIDSGYRTDVVYGFVRTRQNRNIFASKGVEAVGRTPLTRAKKPNREGVKLWTIGTIAMKDIVFARLQISRPGPGYMHFCEQRADVDGIDAEYFAQFESEKVVRRFERGRVRRKYIQVRGRNEALDLEVLNLAALHALGPAVRKNLGELARQVPPAGEYPPGAKTPPANAITRDPLTLTQSAIAPYLRSRPI